MRNIVLGLLSGAMI